MLSRLTLASAACAALALGSVGLAAAAGGPGGQRSDETPLTGDTLTKVTAVATAAVSGGKVVRAETDADGKAKYEVHMTRADGTPVTVYVDDSFKLVSVDTDKGGGHGGGPGGQRGDETPLTGDTLTKVTAVATGAVSGGKVVRAETDADGNAKYEVHMTKADGSPVTVYVDESFKLVKVVAGNTDKAAKARSAQRASRAALRFH